MKNIRISKAFLAINLIAVSVLLNTSFSSIFTQAGFRCDSTNGFSWNGTNCVKTENVNKNCLSHRGTGGNTTTNSTLHKLVNGNCEFKIPKPTVTQEISQVGNSPYMMKEMNIGTEKYFVASYDNGEIRVYQWSGSSINTTPVQTFIVPSTTYPTISIFKRPNGNSYLSTSKDYDGIARFYRWDTNQFVFDSSLTFANGSITPYQFQRKGGNLKYVNTGNGEFLMLGNDVYKFNNTTQVWDFQSTLPVTLSYYLATEYQKIGSEHFMFFHVASYNPGSGCVCANSVVFRFDGTNWVQVKTFTEFYTPLGGGVQTTAINYSLLTPGQARKSYYGGNAQVPYPYGANTLYFNNGYAFEWNGSTFVRITDNRADYNPYSDSWVNATSGNRVDQSYYPTTTTFLDDQAFYVFNQYQSRVCGYVPLNMYDVAPLEPMSTNYCTNIPSGSTASNTGTTPRNQIVINDGTDIYAVNSHTWTGSGGIAVTKITKTKSYPAVCPSTGGYTSNGATSSTCSRIVTQSGGIVYQVELDDIGNASCTPTSLTRTQTMNCNFALDYSNLGYPVQLPTDTTFSVSINTATGQSLPCVLSNPTTLSCNNVPATNSNYGNQGIILNQNSFPAIPKGTVTILSEPQVLEVSPANGPATGGTEIVITGQEFQNGVSVSIGSKDCENIQFISETELRCTVPANSIGRVNLSVTNPDNQSSMLEEGYDYLANDNDVLTPTDEQGGLNNGDSNNDGVQDSIQDNVLNLPVSDGKQVGIEVTAGCQNFSELNYQNSANSPKDIGFQHQNQLVSFKINCRSSVNLTQYWYGLDTSKDYILRKYGPQNPGGSEKTWYNYPATISKVNLQGQNVIKVEYTLTEGGQGDDTLNDNVIVDPVGLALQSTPPVAAALANSNTNDSTPEISGTCQTGTEIELVINSVTYNTTCISGTFNFQINGNLPEGSNPVVIRSTEPTGLVTTSNSNLTTDYTPPQTTVNDLEANQNLSGSIDDPNATVEVNINGTDYTAINNGDGTWTLPTNSFILPETNTLYRITITVKDQQGNSATLSETTTLNLLPTPTQSNQKESPVTGSPNRNLKLIRTGGN